MPLLIRSSYEPNLNSFISSSSHHFSIQLPSMAATTSIQTLTTTPRPQRTKLVCFSFAAYAKNLIDHLKSLNIPVLPGLNDAEFTEIESTFNFTFPPDLRSILSEGLPVGPLFPNWRSSSQQQLQILLNLPVLSLSRNVSLNNFWSNSWGPKPQEKNHDRAWSLVKQLLEKSPVLVPIYRNCYIPSTPNMAGNPVFYIDTEEVKVLSFDLAGFFKDVEFSQVGVFMPLVNKSMNSSIDMPAWAAKEARRIEFWTEVAETGKRVVARCDTRGWWNCGEMGMGLGLDSCLEEVFWRLRDGGWREEEVREMMMMNGCDDHDGKKNKKSGDQLVGNYRQSVVLQTKVLSFVLLRAGWSREDVLDSLNLSDHEQANGDDFFDENSTCMEFQHPGRCSKEVIIKRAVKLGS